MKMLRILYHMARADFLERTRRYSFLVMLGLVLWLGYVSASQQIRLRVPPDYIGAVNSAWVGAQMTVTVTLFLGWFGFYLVKGSLARDYQTGVGQIMATTPLRRPQYTLGKWLSNLAVLGIMILILMVMGIFMNLWVGVERFDLWALVAPLLFIALPCMALVAAVAVLFETTGWLRGGFGNIVYFCAFLAAMISAIENTANPALFDFIGFRLIGDSIAAAAQAAYPEAMDGFAFSVTALNDPKIFHWDGIIWTPEIILPRLFFVLVSIGLVLLAAVLFDRFAPTQMRMGKKQRAYQSPAAAQPEETANRFEPAKMAQAGLTPLASHSRRFRFEALLTAELRLFLKGQRWWWYAAALGLLVGQIVSDLEVARIFLAAAWTWPVLILSGMGCREANHNTRQIVFSAPRPLRNQLLATWLGAFTVLALLGSGALARFVLAGESTSVLGWVTGVLFVPSLALCLGVWSGSSKLFEVIYVLWMYMLIQEAVPFDFLGMTSASPWWIYAPAAGLLLALAFGGRRRQLNG